MKLTILPTTSYVSKERPRNGRAARTHTRWRVTWRVFPDGKTVTRKRGNFDRKGQAEVFEENLRKASLGQDGWGWDANWEPVRGEQLSTVGMTVFELTALYLEYRWPTVSENQRMKIARQCNLLRRLLVTPGSKLTPDAHAYLSTVSHKGPCDPAPELLEPTHASGRRWLMEHSLPVSSMNVKTMLPVHSAVVNGHSYNTARTYWTVVVALVAWAREANLIDHDANPLGGLPHIKRDRNGERVARDTVPSEAETWSLAWAAAAEGGPRAAMVVLLQAFGGLRISEVAGLTRADVRFLADGRAEVRVDGGLVRVTRAYSGTGETVVRRPQKGRTRTTPPRHPQLPPDVGAVLRAYLDHHVGPAGDAPLISGKRAERLCTDSFRQGPFARAVAAAFGAGHRLENLTPHVLRHAAVSYWMRWGVPQKTCMGWGGWESLKVMLDTYVAFLPENDRDIVDAFALRNALRGR
jgi:integrase